MRTLSFNGRRFPRSFPGNKINNQKYNILTFVPVVLFNQFKFFFNLFFLIIALSQFIKVLRVGTSPRPRSRRLAQASSSRSLPRSASCCSSP